MKKGLWLSVVAALFIGIIVYALWYINRRGELQSNSKDSFVPYNSAAVININPGGALPSAIKSVFNAVWGKFQEKLLYKTVYGLSSTGLVSSTSKIAAVRTEGKKDLAFLFVMDNKNVLSGGDIVDFLQKKFGKTTGEARKYDRYRIYTLQSEDEEIFYAVEEGMVLLSDSELYLEDALRQFDEEAENGEQQMRYRHIGKYFSSSAGVNIFLNTSFFSDLLPMFLQAKTLFPHLDITSCFKWGALDGDLREDGISLNGFMDYAGQEFSFMKTLKGQRSGETDIEAVIPAHPASFFILNLTDMKSYFSDLDDYRYDAGLIKDVRKRKQEYHKILGKTGETELKELLQGEFALVNISFNESKGKNEGLIIAGLKSGGLCKAWIEKAVGKDARLHNVHPDSYWRNYKIDREQSFMYYKFPAEDLPAVFWGYLFEGVPAKYALVQDNYLVLGSSEKVMEGFIRDYVHRNFVRDAEWFKRIKTKLSSKYNLAYFADTDKAMPYYAYLAKGSCRTFFRSQEEPLAAFTALAMQWSNEGELLYNTLFFSTEKIKDNKQPHVMWQTKLGAKISMKPVPVMNHLTGEREIFVQDDHHTVYLLNDAGRVLWRLALDSSINSEVFQVDAFRNGKLQYLFSTSTRLYLVDRNGKHVGHFPLTFKADCKRGISLFDYDKNRNYRIFVPCADRQVYLYDIQGKIVKDWKSEKADKDITTRVNHYRVGDKDYIVFADRYRLYILDRRGKERVKVPTVFDLQENTNLYLTHKNGEDRIAFANRGGEVNLVNFQGKTDVIRCGQQLPDCNLNITRLHGGSDELIFTSGNRLSVYDLNGKCLYEKELEAVNLDFPYVYRFSGTDVRIGLVDREKKQMMLLVLDKGMSEGFPICGDSPFSILFADNGNFYLFAGADDGNLIKYKIQR